MSRVSPTARFAAATLAYDHPPVVFGLLGFLAHKSLLQSRLSLVLLVGAVAAGVGFQIPNSANLAGYTAELLRQGVSQGYGEIRVTPEREGHFEDADPMVAKLRGFAPKAIVPLLVLPGAIGHRGRFVQAPVIGLDANATRRPFSAFRGQPLGGADGVLVGQTLARRLRIAVGDTVQLRVVLASSSGLFGSEKERPTRDESLGRYTLRVKGLVGGTLGGHDSVYVERSFLASELGEPRAASALLVYTDRPNEAEALATRIAASMTEARVLAWSQDSAFLQSAIRGNGAIATISHAMVVVAVVIPVWALLYINVLRRSREVALLAAIGLRRREIFAVFVLQALIVGIIGTFFGCALGFGLIALFQAYPIFEMESFVIRPVLSLASFWRPALVVLLATVVAGVYPAWRASRTDPARIFRGEE